ncbi:hypothetical protein HGRIS_011606 [Hohenbuehelia grisea]|uniref:Required for respiratory growth protein 9, mitochondrial n=1 Tax=Hohenbuehelia grisea TaxID=104357 RepID=A0ABR3JXT4_9AGAR
MASLRAFLANLQPCTRFSLHRAYSTALPAGATAKWQLGSYKAPRSILDDDDAPVDLSEDNDAVNGGRSGEPLHKRKPSKVPTPPEYAAHRVTLKKAFPNGWEPPRRISREAMHGLRSLHQADPATFSTNLLAEKFKISPEAVRRILKSRWEPPRERAAKMARRERAEKMERVMQARAQEEKQRRDLAERARVTGREMRGGKEDRFGLKDGLFFR